MAKKHLSKVLVLGEQVITEKSKSITIENPVDNANIPLFHTDVAITLRRAVSVIVNGTSVTFDINRSPNMASGGFDTTNSPILCNDTTSGDVVGFFNSPNIPADNWLRLKIDTVTGSVNFFHITIYYTEDI